MYKEIKDERVILQLVQSPQVHKKKKKNNQPTKTKGSQVKKAVILKGKQVTPTSEISTETIKVCQHYINGIFVSISHHPTQIVVVVVEYFQIAYKYPSIQSQDQSTQTCKTISPYYNNKPPVFSL